jgi:TetR/AcrR family transcriptional regulator
MDVSLRGRAMETQKIPRREREKLAQRQEILSAALDLFSRKGYSNVSVQEIAERAEFAIGTLYKFFRNKEDLYRALIRGQAFMFHDEIMKAIGKSDDEIEKLRNFVKTKGEVFRANASMIRIYFSETQGARQNVLAGFDTEMRELHQKFMRTLVSTFESGMENGRFRRIADPYHLAVALEGMTNAFLFLWLDEPERHPGLEDPDTILNIFFKGLID